MSVAQKDGIRTAEQISYVDLYKRWESQNWSGLRDRPQRRRRRLGGALGPAAPLGIVDLLDVLLRRGLGRRQPLPLHRRGPEGGAEVLPRHPAGRRGAPRDLLPSLLQRGDRRRRLGARRRSPTRCRSSAGATATSSSASTGWPTRCARIARCRTSPAAIALYHMVVEATLAQPGQHYIEDFFVKSGSMPGFSEGMRNVARDEQRHIGFGVKVLSELFAESDECKQAVAELLARGDALLARRLRSRPAGTRADPLLRLRARGHLRLRDPLGAHEVARDRLPAGGDAGRLPDRSRAPARGESPSGRSR